MTTALVSGKKVVLSLCAVLMLTGCKQILSGVLVGPDEMAVVDSAPLTLPPNFELRPPRPGEEQDIDAEAARLQAEALITGEDVRTLEASSAVEPMLSDMPATPTDDAWLFDKIGSDSDVATEGERAVQDVPEKGFFQRTFSKE